MKKSGGILDRMGNTLHLSLPRQSSTESYNPIPSQYAALPFLPRTSNECNWAAPIAAYAPIKYNRAAVHIQKPSYTAVDTPNQGRVIDKLILAPNLQALHLREMLFHTYLRIEHPIMSFSLVTHYRLPTTLKKYPE